METIVIRNGKVIDGTGNPWFKADLLIDNGKIKRIAPKIRKDDAETAIDTSGLIVSPGFIDIHTHSDQTILVSRGENVLTQGVTTHVIGNCGFSMIPPINPDKIEKDEGYSLKAFLTSFLANSTNAFSTFSPDLAEVSRYSLPTFSTNCLTSSLSISYTSLYSRLYRSLSSLIFNFGK